MRLPRVRVALVRLVMDRQARRLSRSLARHVPAGVRGQLVRYDDADPDAWLDIYRPAGVHGPCPAVVWVHGGAWVSGSRDLVGNYLRILAVHADATVIAAGYTLAPKATYPTPVRQVSRALEYLVANADRLHLDPTRLLIAGDSAGAQIAAQVLNIITSPVYAGLVGIPPAVDRSLLRGAILHCGAYDLKLVDLTGPYAGFLKTVLSAYAGTEDFPTDPRIEPVSVIDHVTSTFPPTFISVGNADPLRAQSHALAGALAHRGVPVQTLFFPDEHEPALPHEYQFNLDTPDGKLALARSLAFLRDRLSE